VRRLGLSIPIDEFSLPDSVDIACRAESLGYTDAWSTEFGGYIRAKARCIPNYGEKYRNAAVRLVGLNQVRRPLPASRACRSSADYRSVG
jgi:hypothetical protein